MDIWSICQTRLFVIVQHHFYFLNSVITVLNSEISLRIKFDILEPMISLWKSQYFVILITVSQSLFLTSSIAHILYSIGLQGLCDWRDIVVRSEDESTGYVSPNKYVLVLIVWIPIQYVYLAAPLEILGRAAAELQIMKRTHIGRYIWKSPKRGHLFYLIQFHVKFSEKCC
jgi:hypothetical protein